MNPGGLYLHEGVLFVAGYDKPGTIRAFDLDGRGLDSGAVLERTDGGSAPAISGLAVDADRKLWVADSGSGLVRCLSLFGQEAGSFAPQGKPLEQPLGGQLGIDAPIDVALAQSSKWTGVFAAVPGRRVGAVALYLPDGTPLQTLRSEGDPQAPFRRVVRIATQGELLFVVEAGARRVQVFRAGEFHYSFPAGRLGESSVAPEGRPRALAPVGDGRLVMAVEPMGEGGEDREAGADRNCGLFVLSGRGWCGGRGLRGRGVARGRSTIRWTLWWSRCWLGGMSPGGIWIGAGGWLCWIRMGGGFRCLAWRGGVMGAFFWRMVVVVDSGLLCLGCLGWA